MSHEKEAGSRPQQRWVEPHYKPYPYNPNRRELMTWINDPKGGIDQLVFFLHGYELGPMDDYTEPFEVILRALPLTTNRRRYTRATVVLAQRAGELIGQLATVEIPPRGRNRHDLIGQVLRLAENLHAPDHLVTPLQGLQGNQLIDGEHLGIPMQEIWYRAITKQTRPSC